MKNTLVKHFVNLSQKQLEQFLGLKDIYSDWNQKINVISRKDFDNFNIHHLLHSLAIAKIISFKDGTEVIDIGTGGGFPGIPLSILFPETRFTLLDSIRKKTLVVKEVVEAMGLKNVEVICSRAEEINKEYDFIVSRAVTSFPRFVEWTGKMVKKVQNNQINNGILYLKGGDLSVELEKYKHKVTIYKLSEHFNDSFFDEKKIVYLPL